MASPVRMPALAQTSDELRLIAWLKAEGEEVTEGEPLFEAESDKATHEVEATVSGTLLRVLCEPDQEIEVGTVLAWVGEPGEQIPEPEATASGSHATGSPPGAPDAKTKNAAGPDEATAHRERTGRVLATPVARTLAREHGVDLAQVRGSGPGGRVERRDVLDAVGEVEGQADDSDGDLVPAPRRAIAGRLVRATDVPQFSVSRTIDARRALGRVAQTDGLTLTHLLLREIAVALEQFPRVNRVWVEEGPRFRHIPQANVGLAIASEDTLIVATIPEPHRLSLEELAQTTRRAVEQGRAGRQTAAFSAPAAVTLSNLGMFGIDRFQAIVDPDQTAILAVGRVIERPAVTDEGIIAVAQLDLTLTVDHRTLDGAEAARFLAAICAQLEG
jgi:pyruvate dehydrogenase E2 component (dihydrolipoamide acetyltransferase)